MNRRLPMRSSNHLINMFSARAKPRWASFTVLLLSFCIPRLAASPEEVPGADEIVRRMLVMRKRDEAAKKDRTNLYTFTQRIVKEKLAADGAVSERQELEYEVSPVNGVLTPRLVLKNGKPPTPSDLKAEEERNKRERQKAQEGNQPRDDEDRVVFNEELAAKYEYARVGEETIHGRTAYLISFKPKNNDLPIKRRVDYVLNHVEGRAWIDREDYEMVKVELHLTQKTSFWLGILGTLRNFDASFEQQRATEGVWLPSHYKMHIDARILLSSQ